MRTPYLASAIVNSILQLIYNDFSAFEVHLIGLRRLVEMRGGVDQLGWNGFIKNSIVGYVSIATRSVGSLASTANCSKVDSHISKQTGTV